jgi:hypothetical protein
MSLTHLIKNVYSLAHKICPAKGSTCYNCNKLNHFASVCRNGQSSNKSANNNNNRQRYQNSTNAQQSNGHNSYNNNNRTFSNSSRNAIRNNLRNKGHANNSATKRNTVNNIEELSEDDVLAQFEDFYRNNIQNNQQEDVCVISNRCDDETVNEMSTVEQNKCPHTMLNIGSTNVSLLVDTGTNLNILSSSTYDSLSFKPLLKNTKTRAFGFTSKQRIPLRGEFSINVKFRNKQLYTRFVVLKQEAQNILGYTTAKQLGIVVVNCSNDQNNANVNSISQTSD